MNSKLLGQLAPGQEPQSALAARPHTGRPGKLTAQHKQQLFRWISGKNPFQYGFDLGLWTRRIVRDLIRERCVALLRQLMHRRRKPLHLVVDGLPARKSKEQLQAIANGRALVRSFFPHPDAAYISDF